MICPCPSNKSLQKSCMTLLYDYQPTSVLGIADVVRLTLPPSHNITGSNWLIIIGIANPPTSTNNPAGMHYNTKKNGISSFLHYSLFLIQIISEFHGFKNTVKTYPFRSRQDFLVTFRGRDLKTRPFLEHSQASRIEHKVSFWRLRSTAVTFGVIKHGNAKSRKNGAFQAFHSFCWGTPSSLDGLFHGKSEHQMDDEQGHPLRKPQMNPLPCLITR